MKSRLAGFVTMVGTCATLTLALGGVAFAGPASVPELDPGTAATGVTLLIGGALLLIERYRRQR